MGNVISDGAAAAPGADPIFSDPLVTALCAAFVAFYAFKRFDTPETNRQSTTRTLFLITGVGYVIVTLIFYFFLCEVILRPGVLPFLGQSMKFLADYSRPPILAAIVLTTLLPNIRFLSDWDAWVLKRFQKLGSIPFGVYNLAEEILHSNLPAELEIINLRQWMSHEGDIPNELLSRVGLDATNSPRGSLTQVLRLLHSIEILTSVPGYLRAFKKYRSDHQRLTEEFRVYAAISQAFFVLFDYLQPLEGSAGEDAKKQARDRYLEISNKQAHSTASLLASVLLATEGSETRIAKRLAQIGLDVREAKSMPLPIGPLVFVGAVIVVLILAAMPFLPQPPSAPGAMPYLMVAVLIGITKTVGALAAVLPKIFWNSARASENGRLPYLSWLGWAGFAAIVTLAIERSTFVGLSPHLSTVFDFQRFPPTPMAPTTFIICITIAILCDVDLPIRREWIRRMLEGAICGAAMVMALWICFSQLAMPTATSSPISSLLRFGFPFFIGFFWGAVAPHLYRVHQRHVAGAHGLTETGPSNKAQELGKEMRGMAGSPT
jgi:hypothetical protein